MTADTRGLTAPRAVIAEDETLLVDELRETLAALWSELEVVAVAHDGAEALQVIEKTAPDIAFLDIHMPRLSGLDVARRVAGRCHVVFISAYDQHAVEAFEAGGVDYVLKPIAASRLLTTIERLRGRIGRAPIDMHRALQNFTHVQAGPQHYLQWINASHGATLRVITVNEILYFKADSKYTLVITAHGEAAIRKTIKELHHELDPTQFWQVHRSTIVNVHAIDRLQRAGRGNLVIHLKGCDDVLPVSVQYHALFRQM